MDIVQIAGDARYPREAGVTNLFRRTAQSASMLLAGCTTIWFVSGLAQDQPIGWKTVAVVWLVGWPVLFVGFSLRDLIDHHDPH